MNIIILDDGKYLSSIFILYIFSSLKIYKFPITDIITNKIIIYIPYILFNDILFFLAYITHFTHFSAKASNFCT